MTNPPNQTRWQPRFTLRNLLTLTLLLGIPLAWYSSKQRFERQMLRQANQLRHADFERDRARSELRDRDRAQEAGGRAFWAAELHGHLPGVTFASPGNAFQRTSFDDCNLEDAALQGGGSSFQFARFDRAKLANAKLTGGEASFQEATFVDADLTGAVLVGGGGSFQGSSFENAKFVRARLVGSFQGANISGTHFEGADLSALDSDSLASCYFKVAPSYNKQTKFPAGCDPAALLWRRVSE